MATVPAPARHRQGVTVEHCYYDSNNGDNTSHIENVSPATQPVKVFNRERVLTRKTTQISVVYLSGFPVSSCVRAHLSVVDCVMSQSRLKDYDNICWIL